jgi:RNA polymerase sigma-70 factor (ECF subfamily)
MDQDLELIAKFKSGDLGGFEMLVKKYQNMVVNVVYSLTANRHDAEDIAQDVFMKVYHNISSFRAEAKFSSWLYRIAVNTSYDYLRRNKLKPVSIDEFENFDIADTRQNGDLLAQELVQQALTKIPYEYRSALVLKEIEGLSYQEIAEALKISIGTVESRIFRGRQMLKDILSKKGVFKNEM